MRPFRYLRDPLFLGSCLLYVLNRWGVKSLTGAPFFHDNFNDLLLIPAALPPVLGLQALLGWRNKDSAPTWPEIGGHWLLWSLLAELVLPRYFHHITGDPVDVLAYGAGGVLAGLAWSWFYSSRSDFDWVAPYYGWLEKLADGGLMQKSRSAFLEALSGKILLAGEGHGRFLEILLREKPDLDVTVLDQSGRMMELARKRLRKQRLPEGKVAWLHQDIRFWDPPAGVYDAVVTHYFLDCFSGDVLKEVVVRLDRAAKPGARWVWADFRIPEKGWRRFRARVIVGWMTVFFRVAAGLQARRLEPFEEYLEAQGWKKRHSRDYGHGLVRAECREKTG